MLTDGIRKPLQNPLRRQRLTRLCQPVAAIAYCVQRRTQITQGLHGLPDSAPTYTERLRKVLARVELPIRQLGKHASDQRPRNVQSSAPAPQPEKPQPTR